MDDDINFLILDEPTNHLDIASREWIEEAVEAYDGTLLFVSHDRYFINRFATRIWELANGTITDYPMGFAQYRQMKAQEEAEKVEPPKPVKEKVERPVRGNKAQQAARRQLTICERDIAKAEERITALDAATELPPASASLISSSVIKPCGSARSAGPAAVSGRLPLFGNSISSFFSFQSCG